MKKLYLHIGPHKTGSTYLQKALYSNREGLEENGITYPIDPSSSHVAHHDLAELYQFKKHEESKALADRLIGQCDGSLILSSENFDRLDLESVSKLKKDFEGYEVFVLFFSRNLGELLVSNWQESVKHGSTLAWGEYAFKHLLKPFQSEVINKNKILDVYSDVFGMKALSIFDYGIYEDKDRDIFEDFLGFLRVSLTARKDKNQRVNNSMDYSRVELIRALNSRFTSQFGRVHHFVRTAFLTYLQDNPRCKNISEIEEKIRAECNPVSLDNAFSLKHMDSLFRGKYSSQMLCPELSDSSGGTVFNLPTSSWVFNPYISTRLDSLSDDVEKYTRKLFHDKRW